MKIIISKRIGLVLLAQFCFLFFGFQAYAGTYLGELKWELTFPDNGFQATLFTGITKMGDRYYSIQGYLPIDDDGPLIFNGSGVLFDDKIFMTLHYSQQHEIDYRDMATVHVEVDIITRAGTFWSLGGSFNTSSEDVWFDDFSEGTIELISDCKKPFFKRCR